LQIENKITLNTKRFILLFFLVTSIFCFQACTCDCDDEYVGEIAFYLSNDEIIGFKSTELDTILIQVFKDNTLLSDTIFNYPNVQGHEYTKNHIRINYGGYIGISDGINDDFPDSVRIIFSNKHFLIKDLYVDWKSSKSISCSCIIIQEYGYTVNNEKFVIIPPKGNDYHLIEP